jgi:hypothetical protein
MKRKQIMVFAVSAVVALLCAWSVWRLVSELGDAKAAEQKRNSARGQLDGIYKLKPFPNDANRKQAAADRDAMHAWLNALGALLVDTNAAAALSPSLFMQNLQQDMRELSALSSGSSAKLVPDGFAFGFDRYFGTDGRMPEPEDVPRLSLQLKMTDRICRELAAAGILSLTAIRREEFESGSVKAEDSAPDAGARRPRRRPAAAGASPKAVLAAKQSTRHHFVVEFVARKNAAFDTLNRLAAMDLFVVVTEITIRKTMDDLKAAPPAPTEADKTKGKVVPPDLNQRVIAGPFVDPPMNVRIELDVHVFEGV